MSAYEERQAKIAAEKATWHDRYQTVRDAGALGFWPDAYGAVGEFGDDILAPPTKFGYPRGGVAHPMHVDGHGAGAIFGVWSHHRGSTDETRERPVWLAGKWCSGFYYIPYAGTIALTFDEAVARCIACADHHLAHFIVPMWVGADNHPCLKAEWWHELLAVPTRRQKVQLSLFDDVDPPDSQTVLQRAIRARLRPELANGLWLTIEGLDCIHLEAEIDRANRRRAELGVPALDEAA